MGIGTPRKNSSRERIGNLLWWVDKNGQLAAHFKGMAWA